MYIVGWVTRGTEMVGMSLFVKKAREGEIALTAGCRPAGQVLVGRDQALADTVQVLGTPLVVQVEAADSILVQAEAAHTLAQVAHKRLAEPVQAPGRTPLVSPLVAQAVARLRPSVL